MTKKTTRKKDKCKADGVPVHCEHSAIIPISHIKPNPKNPYDHPPEQVAQLARNIHRLRWRCPITLSTRSGYIVRGHCRLYAAELLGKKTAPVEYQNYKNEAEEIADMLADNIISELSRRDDDMVRDALIEIEAGDLDLLDHTGLDEDERFELSKAATEINVELEPLEIKPAPKYAWVLIATPTTQFGNISELVEQIAATPDVQVETVLSDEEPAKK